MPPGVIAVVAAAARTARTGTHTRVMRVSRTDAADLTEPLREGTARSIVPMPRTHRAAAAQPLGRPRRSPFGGYSLVITASNPHATRHRYAAPLAVTP